MPDRLPSLIVLAGFWIPPAVAGWMAAGSLRRRARSRRPAVLVLAAIVVAYAVAWFFFNLRRMPPYIPGATMDPSFASPEAAAALAVVAGALVLPGSALACTLAFRRRTFGVKDTADAGDAAAGPTGAPVGWRSPGDMT